jgi:hypothetical protein
MTNIETIADKIAKLLAKAERTDNDAEAEAFFAKAAQLQAQHEIDQSLIDEARGDQGANPIEELRIMCKGSYSKATMNSVLMMAKAMGLKGFYTPMGGSDIKVTVMGHKRDLADLETLWASILIQQARGAKRFIDGWKASQAWGFTASERFNAQRSYMMGFGEGVAEILRRVKNDAAREIEAAQGPGVGLVLVKKAEAVEVAFAQRYPRLSKGRGIKITGSAYGAGRVDGRNANTGGRKAIG